MLNNKNSLYLLLIPRERCFSFSVISKIPTDTWDSLRSTPSLRRLCERALPASQSQHCFSPVKCSASPLSSGWLNVFFFLMWGQRQPFSMYQQDNYEQNVIVVTLSSITVWAIMVPCTFSAVSSFIHTVVLENQELVSAPLLISGIDISNYSL